VCSCLAVFFSLQSLDFALSVVHRQRRVPRMRSPVSVSNQAALGLDAFRLPSDREGSPAGVTAPAMSCLAPADCSVSEVLPPTHVFAGLTRNGYRCLLIDPPTRFVAGTKGRPQHYDRMTDADIAALPVTDLLHPEGAWIFLWVTSPKLYEPKGSRKQLSPDAVARAWGRQIFGAGFCVGQDQGKRYSPYNSSRARSPCRYGIYYA
jgi:MT-A70